MSPDGEICPGNDDDDSPPTEVSGSAISRGRTLGPYRLVEVLGRGGQGTVYLAEDSRLERRVALKVLAASPTHSPEALIRFRREVEITARLDHHGICTVYEADSTDAVSYISMQLIDGRTLSAVLDDARRGTAASESLPVPPASWRDIVVLAEFFENVAGALHAAHCEGVVHRDVKPGNIMVSAGNRPVVLDFGLARFVESNLVTLTRSGDFFGTLPYMAPEQILGQRVEVDHRADVYALGVTMYECLTLNRPFDMATRAQLIHDIQFKEPERIRRANPHVPRDLEVVVATAMERDWERRYDSAAELADDLRRLREHVPIHARPASLRLRCFRAIQRRPAAFASILLVALALVLVVVTLSLVEARHSVARLERAEDLRKEAAGLGLERVMELETDLRRLMAPDDGIPGPPLDALEQRWDALAALLDRIEGSPAVEEYQRRVALARLRMAAMNLDLEAGDRFSTLLSQHHPGSAEDERANRERAILALARGDTRGAKQAASRYYRSSDDPAARAETAHRLETIAALGGIDSIELRDVGEIRGFGVLPGAVLDDVLLVGQGRAFRFDVAHRVSEVLAGFPPEFRGDAGSEVALSTGDLDGDGTQEVVGIERQSRMIVVGSKKDDTWTWRTSRVLMGRPSTATCVDLLVTDVDGSPGDEIIASVAFQERRLALLRRSPDGDLESVDLLTGNESVELSDPRGMAYLRDHTGGLLLVGQGTWNTDHRGFGLRGLRLTPKTGECREEFYLPFAVCLTVRRFEVPHHAGGLVVTAHSAFFSRPGLFGVGRGTATPSGATLWRCDTTRGCRPVAGFTFPSARTGRDEIPGLWAADLDGDGGDEIVAVRTRSEKAASLLVGGLGADGELRLFDVAPMMTRFSPSQLTMLEVDGDPGVEVACLSGGRLTLLGLDATATRTRVATIPDEFPGARWTFDERFVGRPDPRIRYAEPLRTSVRRGLLECKLRRGSKRPTVRVPVTLDRGALRVRCHFRAVELPFEGKVFIGVRRGDAFAGLTMCQGGGGGSIENGLNATTKRGPERSFHDATIGVTYVLDLTLERDADVVRATWSVDEILISSGKPKRVLEHAARVPAGREGPFEFVIASETSDRPGQWAEEPRKAPCFELEVDRIALSGAVMGPESPWEAATRLLLVGRDLGEARARFERIAADGFVVKERDRRAVLAAIALMSGDLTVGELPADRLDDPDLLELIAVRFPHDVSPERLRRIGERVSGLLSSPFGYDRSHLALLRNRCFFRGTE